MIKFPNEKELEKLKSFKESACLTIYISSIKSANSNRIQLKNILRKSELALTKTAMKALDIKKTLQPVKKLVDDNNFLEKYTDGLALFINEKIFKYYYLPDIPELYTISIGNDFDLSPLLDVMGQNKSYYVLSLSHKDICLYQGDRYNLSKINLPDLPSDMEKTLNIDEHQKCSETHTISSPGLQRGSEAYHGQYNVSQTDKEMLLKFFQKIDKYLHSFLQRNRKPLIISGVNYLLPIYKKANTYKWLLDKNIVGNQEHSSLYDIRKKALDIIELNSLS